MMHLAGDEGIWITPPPPKKCMRSLMVSSSWDFLLSRLLMKLLCVDTESVKHGFSPTDTRHQASKPLFHSSYCPNLGAWGGQPDLVLENLYIPRSRQHVKELSELVISSGRRMLLLCMEYCPHFNYHSLSQCFLASYFPAWLHPLRGSWRSSWPQELNPYSAWWIANFWYQPASLIGDKQQNIGEAQSFIWRILSFCVADEICQYCSWKQ